MSPELDEKMKEPQRAALGGDWDSFKKFFQNDRKALIEPFDLAGNTAVHVATRSNNPKLIQELLDMLPQDSDRRQALRMGNAQKNTLLHLVIHCENKKMVDTVLDYETHKNLKLHGDKNLLEIPNDLGETPVYRAAKYGKLQMLKHMAVFVVIKEHFQRRPPDGTSILHIAVIGQHLEVALWLSRVRGIDEVAHAKDRNGLTCLQLLCGIPSVFKSCDPMGIGEKLIVAGYYFEAERYINESSYDNDDDQHLVRRGDIESGRENTEHYISTGILLLSFPLLLGLFSFIKERIMRRYPPRGGLLSSAPSPGLFSSIKERMHRYLPRGMLLSSAPLPGLSSYIKERMRRYLPRAAVPVFEPTATADNWVEKKKKEVWDKTKKHKLAAKLADFLVEKDNSWMSSNHVKQRKEVVWPVIQPTNVSGRKKAKIYNNEVQSFDKPVIGSRAHVYTPLLLAASRGIVEIVKKILDCHPTAIYHVSHDEHNILHVTVKHRQDKIYKLLKKYGALRSLAAQISNEGCTLLHHAAMMDYYDGGNQAGVVFQLRGELRWFERIKKIIPGGYVGYCNDNNLTARELFELEHSDMLKEAQDWIKGTAQSCSAVAVLVATVVFAAAFTVPGGTEKGVPVFHKSFIFRFFVIMDAVALASSLLSVMMFLSILTSPFQMQDFYENLPLKLADGFGWLLISLTTTMMTFGSTIIITAELKKIWICILIYGIMVFPFIISGLTQYPIMTVKYRLRQLIILLKILAETIAPLFVATIKLLEKKFRQHIDEQEMF